MDTRARTGMIRQSIVRGIAGAQKRRAKSACDATAMLRFFRARCGATTGCALFPASVLCFPAVDPLHRQIHTCKHDRTHAHRHGTLRRPCGSPSSPSLFPVERVRRRAFFEYSTFGLSLSGVLRLSFFSFLCSPPPPLLLSLYLCVCVSRSLSSRYDGIDRPSIYNFLDVTRLFARTDQFPAKSTSPARRDAAIRVKSRREMRSSANRVTQSSRNCTTPNSQIPKYRR